MPKPRNLTAAAYDEHIANPPAAHIKDSVSNTAPGLEFDERSIDKYVFPGLALEFQRLNQDDDSETLPVVRTLDQARTVSVHGRKDVLTFDVDSPRTYLYVYAIKKLDGAPQTYRFYRFRNSDRGPTRALDCWNAIRTMPCREDERIALLIGVGGLTKGPHWKRAIGAFNNLSARRPANHQFPAATSANNPLIWAVVVQKRAPLEDSATGLIFPDVPPGDLQSTMCTPWHYDFRDCHCYYWASNRPDMVSTEGPEERNVHFLRKRKQVWEKTPIPAHIWGAPPENADELARQRKALWNHVEVINNWESLPVVLDDTEVLWPYRKVIEKLEVLAGIEHALAVEYLHAYHSVDPKFVLDGHPVGRQARDVLLKIATDEMRHLRWVNEILILLDDRRTVIDRADNYGPNFDWRGFQLRPLDQATLDWFIRIEKPSAQEHVNEQLEGLYIGVQREILYEISEKDATGQPSAFGDRANVQKILSLIKLIMLEGEGHYRQLADLKVRLFSREDTPHHLRPVSARAPSDAIRLALDISDTIYQALLFGLGRLFALGVHGDGSELQQLIDSMHVMSRLNERLAELGYPASFQKPEISPVTEDWDGWLKVLRDHIRDLDRKIGTSAFADAELQQAASAALNKAKRCCRL